MDGPHDLGGKEGFGPIDVEAPGFRHDWERRQWALSKTIDIPGVMIDNWRATMETMPPAAYLALPYFAKWNFNDLVQLIARGVFTADEAVAGHVERPAPAAPPRDLDAMLARLRTTCRSFARPATSPARFAVGDTVRTLRHPVPGHTRLPAYARSRSGTVIAHHGAHIFADKGAEGAEVPEHLYTVSFTAPELWGSGDPRDTVTLDLWEPYLAAP